MTSLKQCLVSTVYLLAIVSGTFYFVILLPLLVLAYTVSRRLLVRLSETFSGSIITFFAICTELAGTQFHYYGEEGAPSDRSLVMMNHNNELDWFYFYNLSSRFQSPKNLKFTMKREIRYIPILGVMAQIAANLFLRRNWASDQGKVDRSVRFYQETASRIQLLLFCEGTCMSPPTKAKSDEYARKNGLPLFKHVLHPRTTGFVYLINQLGGANEDHRAIDYIYDVTVAYRGTTAYSAVDLIRGSICDEVHFHMTRFPIESIPTDDEGLRQWLMERWLKKEHSLDSFHTQGYFTGNPRRLQPPRNVARTIYVLCASVLSFVAGVYLLVCSAAFRWYILALLLASPVISKFPGIDNLVFIR